MGSLLSLWGCSSAPCPTDILAVTVTLCMSLPLVPPEVLSVTCFSSCSAAPALRGRHFQSDLGSPGRIKGGCSAYAPPRAGPDNTQSPLDEYRSNPPHSPSTDQSADLHEDSQGDPGQAACQPERLCGLQAAVSCLCVHLLGMTSQRVPAAPAVLDLAPLHCKPKSVGPMHMDLVCPSLRMCPHCIVSLDLGLARASIPHYTDRLSHIAK